MITRETVLTFLTSELGLRDADVTDDTPLFSTGLLDSFGLVELVGFIEKEISTKVGAMEVTLENLDTIGRILDFSRAKAQAAG